MTNSRNLGSFEGSLLSNNHMCGCPMTSHDPFQPGCWIFTATALPTSKAKVTRVPDLSVAAKRTRPLRPSKAKLPLTSPSPSKVVLRDQSKLAHSFLPSTYAGIDEWWMYIHPQIRRVTNQLQIAAFCLSLNVQMCKKTGASTLGSMSARIAKEIINDALAVGLWFLRGPQCVWYDLPDLHPFKDNNLKFLGKPNLTLPQSFS